MESSAAVSTDTARTRSPEALDWSIENCTVQRALAVLGDRWTFVVLREVFNGIRRFDDMRVRTSIPRQVLSDRLAMLVSQGLLRREPYRQPSQRQRFEYWLTQKGLDLYPILVALNEWGTEYYADAQGSPLAFRHRHCQGEVSIALHCSEGHEVTEVREVLPAPGPGARRVRDHSPRSSPVTS
jgi:DNA-binding HxlR family transcriptional regulator